MDTIPYDKVQHDLLGQIAHRALLTPEEFDDFVNQVRAKLGESNILSVQVPEWPPVPYQPLVLLRSITGVSVSAWWDRKFFSGTQLAVESAAYGEFTIGDEEFYGLHPTLARKIARRISGDEFSPKRMQYIWQCEIFNPDKHIVVRTWLDDNGADIVAFYRQYFKRLKGIDPSIKTKIFKTTNPYIQDELEQGSYSPTRRCVHIDDLDLLVAFKQDRNPRFKSEPEKETVQPIQPPIILETDKGEIPAIECNLPKRITDGMRIFSPSDVTQALFNCFGKYPRYFSGTTTDSKIVGVTRQAVDTFLKQNKANQKTYIKDAGSRNFDCENFSEYLRSDFQTKTGINGIGIVAGDGHAWNFFVINNPNRDTPEILFIEPQDDRIVTQSELEISGMYSTKRRCEVLL